MGLLFGMPGGISDDEEQAMAAIQTWAGKKDADGRLVLVPFTTSDFRIEGAGNSWSLGSKPDGVYLCYALNNEWMTLNVNIGNSTVVASGTSVTQVRVLIPDQFKATGPEGLIYHGIGTIINAASSSFALRLYINADSRLLNLAMADGTALADGVLTVRGSISFAVTRS